MLKFFFWQSHSNFSEPMQEHSHTFENPSNRLNTSQRVNWFELLTFPSLWVLALDSLCKLNFSAIFSKYGWNKATEIHVSLVFLTFSGVNSCILCSLALILFEICSLFEFKNNSLFFLARLILTFLFWLCSFIFLSLLVLLKSSRGTLNWSWKRAVMLLWRLLGCESAKQSYSLFLSFYKWWGNEDTLILSSNMTLCFFIHSICSNFKSFWSM